ncbi:MAG: DUF4434 domain-containing protein [Ruminococcaceae bacterium]|nr:DUF4434 domain-containing protein [Oscillospiraceae bacterium]
MSAMKPITGTFFEFEHGGEPEGKYYNHVMRAFTEDQWRAQVRETAEIGMDTLIILATAMPNPTRAYFPFDEMPYAEKIECKNALEAVMDEADKTGQEVYMAVGMYGTTDTVGNTTDPVIIETALRAMNRLYELYGHHKSFVGWYISDEWCIWDHFDERFISYINKISAHARTLGDNNRVILAPFGTYCLQADDVFAEQLTRLDCYAIAYQDEVGVQRMKMEELAWRYEKLAAAHEKAGRSKLWVDMEVFCFDEGNVYSSALCPAPWERIAEQLKAHSPYVEKVVIYSYQGLMTKPGSVARLGYPERAEQLYTDYVNWLKEQ